MIMLIDSSSSYNFVNLRLVRRLNFPVEQSFQLKIMIANGVACPPEVYVGL